MSDPKLPHSDQSAVQTEPYSSQSSRATVRQDGVETTALSSQESPTTQPARRRTSGRSHSHSSRRSQSHSGSRLQSYSRRKSGKHSPWSLPWRRAVAFWNYWKPKKLLSGSVSRSATVIQSMLNVDGPDKLLEIADERYLVRTWPSRRTLWNPLWWFNNALSFAVRWLVTRRLLSLLLATPAVAVALSLYAAIVAGSRIAPGTEGIVYKRMLTEEPLNVDPAQARLALDALMRIDPDNATIVFDRAQLEHASGDIKVARLIMGELATSAKSQRAALWLANDVGDIREFSTWSKQQMLDYHSWLQVAVENNPNNPGPRRMLADVRALVGNKRGAYEALLPIADLDTNTSFMCYFLQKDLGFNDEALARSERLMRVLRSRLQDNPSDQLARVQLSLLLTSQEQFSEAMQLIESGFNYANTVDAQFGLKRVESEILMAEAEYTARTDATPEGLLTRLLRLLEAVAVDANNPKLKQAVAQACFEAADSEAEGLAVHCEAILQNVDKETAHYIQGTIALKQGKLPEATKHLEAAVELRKSATERIELAARQNSNIPTMFNNLAHALCFGEQPDLPRALEFANTANMLQPNLPYLRETRGQIYLRLQQYSLAIADLEVALNAEELRAEVRESLAQAYEALGQTEIALRQRELASQGR